MQRISSGMTFFYKRIFPVIWFGFLLLFMAAYFLPPSVGGKVSGSPVGFFLVPALMMIIGYFAMKKLVFDLVDEVLDAGDALVVRNGDREERVALVDIINVNYVQFSNPPRITLSLRIPSQFGDEVTFCAPARFNPFMAFSKSPVIDELIKRIDAARRSSHGRR